MRAELLADAGTGPAVVFLPGMDGTGELLLGTTRRIESRFRLLRMRYVDEGFAGSSVTYETLADSVAERLTDAGIDQARILAESFGGGVALQLALRHPSRVRGLTLVNTFAWFPRRLRLTLGALAFPWTPKALLRASQRLTIAQVFFRPRRDAEVEAAFLRVAVGFEERAFGARLHAIRHLDLRSSLGEIDVPVDLYASANDRVVPSLRTMRTLEEGLPRATLTTIPRANHIVLPLADEPWVERLLAAEGLQRRATAALAIEGAYGFRSD